MIRKSSHRWFSVILGTIALGVGAISVTLFPARADTPPTVVTKVDATVPFVASRPSDADPISIATPYFSPPAGCWFLDTDGQKHYLWIDDPTPDGLLPTIDVQDAAHQGTRAGIATVFFDKTDQTQADGYKLGVNGLLGTNGGGGAGQGEPLTWAAKEWGVEIQFNNTSDTGDDMVMLSTDSFGSDIPANQPALDVAIRMVGTPPPGLTVTLDNPDGRLAFGPDAPTAQPVTQPTSHVTTQPTTKAFSLPADHSWLHLPAFGVNVSKALKDASVRVTGNFAGAAGGVVLTTKGVTVFWFKDASITVTADDAYSFQKDMLQPNALWFEPVDGNGADGNGVNFSAQASISIAGLDPTAPQLQNLRIAMVQNVVDYKATFEYNNPNLLQWLPNVQPKTVTTPVPVTFDHIRDVAGIHNDSALPFTPLYAFAGEADIVLPLGLPGGGVANSGDTPRITDSVNPVADNFLVPGNPQTAWLAYSQSAVSFNADFRIWTVVYDVGTKQVIAPLRETTWKINCSTALAQKAAPLGTDFVPVDAPVLKPPLANNAPQVITITPVGKPVQTWTK